MKSKNEPIDSFEIVQSQFTLTKYNSIFSVNHDNINICFIITIIIISNRFASADSVAASSLASLNKHIHLSPYPYHNLL